MCQTKKSANMLSRRLCLLLLLFVGQPVFAASWHITYPKPVSDQDKRTLYPLALLALALDQTGVNYHLKPSSKTYPQRKNLSRLEDNREINIVWSMTDAELEKDLLPIRIPLYKGLIGWRVFLIREDMQERFTYINTLENLVKMSAIQGTDWADTPVLRAAGFDVFTHLQYAPLFDMLSNAQGDFFPRSILEVWDELEIFKPANPLILQPSLGLRYPAAVYFFLNKKNQPLANLIETGLERAIANGEFDALFDKWFKEYIDKTKLEERTFFSLENINLPNNTPLQRPELWFSQSKAND